MLEESRENGGPGKSELDYCLFGAGLAVASGDALTAMPLSSAAVTFTTQRCFFLAVGEHICDLCIDSVRR